MTRNCGNCGNKFCSIKVSDSLSSECVKYGYWQPIEPKPEPKESCTNCGYEIDSQGACGFCKDENCGHFVAKNPCEVRADCKNYKKYSGKCENTPLRYCPDWVNKEKKEPVKAEWEERFKAIFSICVESNNYNDDYETLKSFIRSLVREREIKAVLEYDKEIEAEILCKFVDKWNDNKQGKCVNRREQALKKVK